MRSIRYDQQFIEDCARSVLRMETRLDASLCDLEAQADALERMSGAGSSGALSAAAEKLRALKRLVVEKEEELARLRSGLTRVADIFEETEAKLKRDFAEAGEAKAYGLSESGAASASDQAGSENVAALVDSLFIAARSSDIDTSRVSDASAFEWLRTDFDICGVAALDGVKRVAVAAIAPKLNTVGSYYDVIAPEWMLGAN